MRWVLFALAALTPAAALAQGATDPAPADEAAATASSTEVVVHGQRRAERTDGAATTEISGDRLRESSRPSLFEAVAQDTPGLHVTSRGAGFHGVASGASGGIHLRGLGGSPNTQVLVIEDGVPDYQGLFGHPIPDAYSPYLVDTVEVVRGGDSTLYGTNALGGVVIIENRRRSAPGWELHNDVAYGSYATLREQLALLAASDQWDAAGAFTTLSSDGHRDGAGGHNVVGHASLRWRPRRTLWLTLSTKRFHGEGADPGPTTHPNVDHFYDVRRATTSLRLDALTGGARWRLLTYLNQGEHRLFDGFHSRDHVAGASAEVEQQLGAPLLLLLGTAADATGGDVENQATLEEQIVDGTNNVAAYGQLTIRPWSFLELVAGARGIFNAEQGAVPVYKVAGRLEPWSGIAFRARASRSFRQPTLRELYLPFPTANPDLEPEYSTTLDAGVDIARGVFSGELTAYRTSSDHLIRYFGAFPTAEVVNIDDYQVHGLEALASIDEVGPFGATLSGSWQDVGRYTKQNPSHIVRFSLRAKSAGERGWVSGELGGEWVGGLYENNYRRDPVDDVFFLDASLRYHASLPARDVDVIPYLLLRNLLDATYEYVPGYRMPGFNAMTGLEVSL
jgi:outer membrane receptor protein involved in Fe transport